MARYFRCTPAAHAQYKSARSAEDFGEFHQHFNVQMLSTLKEFPAKNLNLEYLNELHSTTLNMTTNTAPRQVLLISLSHYLHGKSASSVIDKNWSKHTQEQSTRFNTVGFDFDANDVPTTLKDLESKIHAHEWDGVMVGWCLRGNPERTALFEQVVSLCTGAMRDRPQMKLMFCSGPDNVADATLRNFPGDLS